MVWDSETHFRPALLPSLVGSEVGVEEGGGR